MKNKLFFLFFLLIFLAGCSYEKETFRKLEKQGDTLFSQGRKKEAIERWQDALKFKKTSSIYEKIVVTLIMERENKQATMWAEQGLTYFPDCCNLIYNLSYLCLLEKNYDKCLKNIDRLLAINKYYPEAHFMKGMIFEQTGRIKEAKEEYVKELNINPGCKKAWKKIKEIGDEK